MNKVTDALSRQPSSLKNIAVMETEEACPCNRRKYGAVVQNPEKNTDYCIRDGKLYRHFWKMTDPVTHKQSIRSVKAVHPKTSTPYRTT